ncbi:hypothetical protein F4677DRAFT_46456 [Hypoxylon crocopeplum]|nr:hypothetical protein F4677DRAFT_46456 [Hypoxylon crocopeplum]
MSSGKPWTEGEKIMLLVGMIDHVDNKGARPHMKDVHVPGRSARSINHTWSKIREEVDKYRQEHGMEPTKKRSRRASKTTDSGGAKGANGGSRRQSKMATPVSSDDDEEFKPSKKPRLDFEQEKPLLDSEKKDGVPQAPAESSDDKVPEPATAGTLRRSRRSIKKRAVYIKKEDVSDDDDESDDYEDEA